MNNEYKTKIETLVNNISESYKKESYIEPHDCGFSPNRNAIIDTTKALRQLVFPSYFGKTNFRREIQDYHIGDLLICIIESLTKQITLALKHQAAEMENFGEEHYHKEAQRICYEFMSKIPQIREFLATDVIAAFDGDPAAKSRDEIIFCYPGVFAISVHRLAHELYDLSVPLIPRIMSEYAHNITGIDIHPGATIGKYFFIDHGTGVVIGETAVIGEHVKIYQGVTLGALSTRGGQKLRGVRRHPCLEDEVTVYSGASILGGDTIVGKGSVIGSNVFITKSVPEGTTVSIKTPELHFSGQEIKKITMESFDWVI
ncbi:serine acetyltransferase [Acetobacterium paludosum]|uniref:Serine acetyltransferase n=1 Tax=Acetobacterium paludosum TaxID=52693 RepID=A0A923HZM9_9FIRM|nr:serine O-acetyltransferase EpsC [Acetobacterium paludosum]MBC3889554.1 serine acetyltransferase [Acetobacterium paludosum]